MIGYANNRWFITRFQEYLFPGWPISFIGFYLFKILYR